MVGVRGEVVGVKGEVVEVELMEVREVVVEVELGYEEVEQVVVLHIYWNHHTYSHQKEVGEEGLLYLKLPF